MLEHGGEHGGQPDLIDERRNGTAAKPVASLSCKGREALGHSLAALVDCCAALRVSSIAEPANIVCTLLWRTVNLADAVKIAVQQLRAEGECLGDIAVFLNHASQSFRPDFDSVCESVARRFGPSHVRLVQKVAVHYECHGSESWTVDPTHLEENPVWIAASEEDREAYRAMKGLECLALSLCVLDDSLRPKVDTDGGIPF